MLKVATQMAKSWQIELNFANGSSPTACLSKKSPLVRLEMVFATSGAQRKEQPDVGAMGSQEKVKCKRQGDWKLIAWCGLVDGKMLEVRWMVDKNGRPQTVTLRRYQDMLLQYVRPEV